MDDRTGQLWRAFAGRGGKRPPETPGDAIRALTAAGASRREIAQFKKDVAAELGVSVRQVQRMTTITGTERRGTAKHAAELRKLTTQHPKVRAASVSSRRTSRMANHGARLRIKGTQGPAIGGRDYKRDRTIERYVDGDTMAEVRDAWEAGDDARAEEILRDSLESEGYPAWEWDSSALLEFLGEHRER